MLSILREHIVGDKIIREYSKDGVTVSHKLETPISEETDGDIITLPENPILALREENAMLNQKVQLMQQAIDELLLGGI